MSWDYKKKSIENKYIGDKQLAKYNRKSLWETNSYQHMIENHYRQKNSEQKTIENHNRDNKQLAINDCKSLQDTTLNKINRKSLQETTLGKINRKSLQETTLSKINRNHDKRQHLAK